MNKKLKSEVLPNQNEAACPPANLAGSTGASPHETRTARILIVDDQPGNIRMADSVLGKLGHQITGALDGASALKLAASNRPDLILLDVLMPEMDGCEVCRRLKLNPKLENIPVIFLSAADDKDLIVRALDSGGVDYITKPFNQAELISRVNTQLALKAARDRLARLAEDKSELIYVLTHDLKDSIGDISMSAMYLHEQHKKLNDGRLTLLSENILRASELLLAFVKEFLANAATDYGFALDPAPVNPAKIVERVVEQYREAAGRKGIGIEADISAAGCVAWADALALDQVVENLVSNAVKFSPAGRRVWVSVRGGAGVVELAVRDEGPGFSAADQARMFRRYGRLSARPTGGEASTGLGLSIVRKLTQEMKGELFCESAPGQGATFTVRLPQPPE